VSQFEFLPPLTGGRVLSQAVVCLAESREGLLNSRNELIAILATGIRESQIMDPGEPNGKKWDDLHIGKHEALHYARAALAVLEQHKLQIVEAR
jgi:hypothetical protein